MERYECLKRLIEEILDGLSKEEIEVIDQIEGNLKKEEMEKTATAMIEADVETFQIRLFIRQTTY